MDLNLEKLTRLITFITESYVFGQNVLDSEKIRKKKVKISREHIVSILEAMRDMIDTLESTLDVSDYSLRISILQYLLESYDSLSKCIKYYYYVKKKELAEKGDNIDHYIDRLAVEDLSDESEEEI